MEIQSLAEHTEICSSRLGNCEVCDMNAAKYTCPKCEVKTCALKCNKIHKEELDCDGHRNKTKYVSLKKFTNLELSSDYRMLEEISRGVQTSKKIFGKPIDSHVIPTHLFKLRNAAKRRNTTLKFLPHRFSRHRNNSTKLNFKTQIIYWHIEWIFINAENLRLIDRAVPETDKLSTVINKYLLEQKDPALQDKLQFYQAAGISGLKLFLKAEQKKDKTFYELDTDLTLKDSLAGKLIIEYPTIHVLLKDHGSAYYTIDSDDEDGKCTLNEEKNNDLVNSGRHVVEKILRKAENYESSSKSLKNLLFLSEYSDEELSE